MNKDRILVIKSCGGECPYFEKYRDTGILSDYDKEHKVMKIKEGENFPEFCPLKEQ